MDNYKPYPRRTPLEQRAERIFEPVVRGPTHEQWVEWLRVPLEHAAAAGNTELFDELLEAGADASAGWSGCGGRSLLGAAAYGGNVEVVSAVLEAGSQPDVDVALHMASELGNEAVGKRLILAGADVNFIHPVHQSTPLHGAVHGCEQLVKDLLEAGASTSVQQADEYRRTPLHIAADEGHDGIVSALLRNGADVSVLDAHGNSPLIWAAKGGHLAVVETLLTEGADVSIEGSIMGFLASSALSVAAALGHLGIMEAIIDAGADVNGTGIPALHCAAVRGQVGAMDTLIKAGAEVDGQDWQGMTPLLHAAQCDEFDAMDLLLEHGAAVNTRSRRGDRALRLVCRHRRPGFDAAIRHLLENGADETGPGIDGLTPAQSLDMPVPIWPLIPPDKLRRAKELVARAPVDRAWRRRGWLVLLRGRAENEGAFKRGKVGGGGVAPSFRSGGAEGIASDGPFAEADDEETDGILIGVVDMLVRRAPDGVFRTVLKFL